MNVLLHFDGFPSLLEVNEEARVRFGGGSGDTSLSARNPISAI